MRENGRSADASDGVQLKKGDNILGGILLACIQKHWLKGQRRKRSLTHYRHDARSPRMMHQKSGEKYVVARPYLSLLDERL
jgi:hypothetical protein